MDFFSKFTASIKDDYPLNGAYYSRRPLTTSDVAEGINYKPLDPSTRRYGSVISNLKKDEQLFTIQTITQCKYKVGGYIVTQDGTMWQIAEIRSKADEGNVEALRLFRETAKTVHVLSLIEVDNPLGLTPEAY